MTSSNNAEEKIKSYLALVTGIISFLVGLYGFIEKFSLIAWGSIGLILWAALYYISVAKKAPEIVGGRGTYKYPRIQPIAKWLHIVVALLLLVFVSIGLTLKYAAKMQCTQQTGAEFPYLTSITYMEEEWDPRKIELSTSAKSGIPVYPTHTLKFFDVIIQVPDGFTGYEANVEVYAGEIRIGMTDQIKTDPGAVNLGKVMETNFKHGVYDSWIVREDWEELEIRINLIKDEEIIYKISHMVRINPDGTSWYIQPSYASISSILIVLNDETELIVDFQQDGLLSIPVETGDILEVKEIWYRTNAEDIVGGQQIRAEVYLSSGSYDSETIHYTAYTALAKGNHPLILSEPFRWEVPDGKDSIVITLAKNPRIVLDRLIIQLESSTSED